jgi:glycolate oxidase
MSNILSLIDHLRDICGNANVISDQDALRPYGSDRTQDLFYPFDVLLKPGSAYEVSEILKLCSKHKIPVTPRGGGSGVTGGALPVHGGVVLSLERLNKIIAINKVDGYVIAEAGVVTSQLCDAVEREGLFFPVAPSSKDFSFIGGNIAENAGSINSCKYGTTSQFVLNLEVVLPEGEIIWTGANVAKNATGCRLTQLFVGSEGMLGVITKIVYRLITKPKYDILLLAGFSNLEDAYGAILEIKKSDIAPSCVELICEDALHLTATYLGKPLPLVKDGIRAHVLIGLHEFRLETLEYFRDQCFSIVEKYTDEEILLAESSAEKEKLTTLRFSIAEAMTDSGTNYRDIDACVPLSALLGYILKVQSICKEHGIALICFGHALDGNLHTMLLYNTPDSRSLNQAAREIYRYAISLGGVISGEHGIGLLQKEYLNYQFTDAQIHLMKKIKKTLDPNLILNPGKFL